MARFTAKELRAAAANFRLCEHRARRNPRVATMLEQAATDVEILDALWGDPSSCESCVAIGDHECAVHAHPALREKRS